MAVFYNHDRGVRMNTLFIALLLSISIIGSSASLFAAGRGPGRPTQRGVPAAVGGAGAAAGGGASSGASEDRLTDAAIGAMSDADAALLEKMRALKLRVKATLDETDRVVAALRDCDERVDAANAALLCACEKDVLLTLQAMLLTPGFDLRDVDKGTTLVEALDGLPVPVRERYTLTLSDKLGSFSPPLDPVISTWVTNVSMYCQDELNRAIKHEDGAEKKAAIAKSLRWLLESVSASCKPGGDCYPAAEGAARRDMVCKVAFLRMVIAAAIFDLTEASVPTA